MQKTVKAKKIKAGPEGYGGDYLVGLDNGYVVEVDRGEYDVTITFHDAEGGENTLTCGLDMPVLVERK